MLGSIFIAIAFIGLLVWRIMMSSPDNIGKAGERRVARKYFEDFEYKLSAVVISGQIALQIEK